MNTVTNVKIHALQQYAHAAGITIFVIIIPCLYFDDVSACLNCSTELNLRCTDLCMHMRMPGKDQMISPHRKASMPVACLSSLSPCHL